MKGRLVIFPGDEGFAVVVWAKWTRGSMKVRHFEARTEMIRVLEALHLITIEDARKLEEVDVIDYCPLFSAEVDEDLLVAHGFEAA